MNQLIKSIAAIVLLLRNPAASFGQIVDCRYSFFRVSPQVMVVKERPDHLNSGKVFALAAGNKAQNGKPAGLPAGTPIASQPAGGEVSTANFTILSQPFLAFAITFPPLISFAGVRSANEETVQNAAVQLALNLSSATCILDINGMQTFILKATLEKSTPASGTPNETDTNFLPEVPVTVNYY